MPSGPSAAERLVTLDVIRGIAVMGIFSVNVVAMAMIQSAYFYPLAYGYEGWADGVMWAANFVLIEGKMRSLFSMLFGASMLLVIDRAEAAGRSPAATHFARMAVLLGIGLVHFYLIWWGDILATYAIVGAVAYAVRRQPAAILLMLSLLLFAIEYVPAAAQAPARLEAQAAAIGPRASGEDKQAWRDKTGWVRPTPAELQQDAAAHATPLTHLLAMVAEDRRWKPLDSLRALFLETLALMLLGMAGYRSGFLTGTWSRRSYRRVAAAGVGIGGAAFAALAGWVVLSDFRPGETLTAYFDLSGPFRPLMAVGYAAIIILLLRRASPAQERLAAVGQCAFSNYLGASLVGVLVFFDCGLGLYGKVTRAEAWLLVPVVWAGMLLWSKSWLERFNHGPLEWLWRSISRWKLQPMRRHPSAA